MKGTETVTVTGAQAQVASEVVVEDRVAVRVEAVRVCVFV